MSDWIFLSKNGEDDYVNMFARGCGSTPVDTDDFNYYDSDRPIVLRGILKHKIMKRCLAEGRDFYYVDTGYFGNQATNDNPDGWKIWHRIVKNDLQHGTVVDRPDDRFLKFDKKFSPWKKNGRKILIAKPDEKPCKYYGIDLEKWTSDTISEIRKYTDRPIEIRERAPLRKDRTEENPLTEALDNDVFALVTFNSTAATESIFHGIPVFTLAPTNAAAPVSLQDLSLIETPRYADSDELYKWACHLAYGQFHVSEMRDGSAKIKLEEWF